MPIPKPKKGEDKDSFISRCMSDDTMQKEYPDKEQRMAVCISQTEKGENMNNKENVKRDEKGRIIVAENVNIVFNGEIEVE